jgi:hypothetical protein
VTMKSASSHSPATGSYQCAAKNMGVEIFLPSARPVAAFRNPVDRILLGVVEWLSCSRPRRLRRRK